MPIKTIPIRAAIGRQGTVLIHDKLQRYRQLVKSLESQKDNPSVSKNYWRAVGVMQALEACHDLSTGGKLALSML